MVTTIKPKSTQEEKLNIEEQIIEYKKNNEKVKNVVCPRCGHEIIFTEIGSSYTVKCESADCISYSVRGI